MCENEYIHNLLCSSWIDIVICNFSVYVLCTVSLRNKDYYKKKDKIDVF